MFTQEKTVKFLKVLIFSGLLVLVALIFSQKISFTSIDLGRHMANGRVIWSDSRVLFKNLYSYTEPDTAFINHHWLVGIIYYAVYLVGGFNLLSVLNVSLALLTFIISFSLARKKAGFYLPAILSIPIIFLLSERVEIRPEIFSYFFIVLTWFILNRADEKKNYRLLYWLFPLFFVWVNIHSYFFLGLGLVGFRAAEEFLPIFIKSAPSFKKRFLSAWEASRVWFINLACLFLVCLLNPNFIGGLLYPFNVFKKYSYEIAESKSIFYLQNLTINYNIPLFKIVFFLFVFSFIVRFFFSKKIRLTEIFIGALFSILALFAIRNITIFASIALVLISINLSYPFNFLKEKILDRYPEIEEKIKIFLSGAILCLVFIGIIYIVIDSEKTNYFMKNSLGWNLSQGSEDSIVFFRNNKLSGPIFNNYDLGSALDFWLYPAERVFVDNRPEAFSDSFFNDVYRPMQTDKDKWEEYEAKYQFKVVYFSHTDGTPWAQNFLEQILANKSWNLVYFDRYTVILLNNKRNSKEILDNLSLKEPAIQARLRSLADDSSLLGKFYVASFARLVNQSDIAEEIYRGIIFSNPDNKYALRALGSIYASSNDRTRLQRAIYYYQRALNEGFKLPSVYNQIALIYWQLGYYSFAEDNWQASLKINKKDASAIYYLNQVKQFRLQGLID